MPLTAPLCSSQSSHFNIATSDSAAAGRGKEMGTKNIKLLRGLLLFFFKEMKRLRTEIHDGSTCKSARSVRHESVSHHRAEMTRLLRCLFPLCFSPAAAPMLLLPIWILSSSSSSSELPAPSTSPCSSPTSSVLQDSCPSIPPCIYISEKTLYQIH